MKNYPFIYQSWWKFLAIGLLLYAIIGGLLIPVPRLDILNETIRNAYYHVTLWFAMMILCTVSVTYSIKYLLGASASQEQTNYKALDDFDTISESMLSVALWFSILGLITGSLWARFTWGSWWENDPKLNGVAISLVIYWIYFILRSLIEDRATQRKISAIYNIFAYVMFMLLIMIMPRLQDSLHPGNGGNPAFGTYDMDNTMRMVFYPAIIGFTLLGVWIATLLARIKKIDDTLQTSDISSHLDTK